MNYPAYTMQKSPELPALPIQYKDFASWEREQYNADKQEFHLAYWNKQLDPLPPELRFPYDRPRPAVQSFRGATHTFSLSQELHEDLNNFSREQKCTLFITLLTAFNILLHRYTRQTDIIIGSPIANRTNHLTEDLIGFFVNMLTLRTKFTYDATVLDLLNQVHVTALESYEHQDFPFERVVDELNIKRTLSHQSVFQIVFVLQTSLADDIQLPGLTLHPVEFDMGTATFDLMLSISETKSGLKGHFEFSTDLFNASTIERMSKHFRILLENLVANPRQSISKIPFATDSEVRRLLVEQSKVQADHPTAQFVQELFELQVKHNPNKIALMSESQQLTYKELNAKANQLARYLIQLGVGPDVLVGICITFTFW
ncbi:AMP-binding protein [Chloroflexi bacterium TSY]|nr:AMP-binding protein [Chloroflexi bacterium TSY]